MSEDTAQNDHNAGIQKKLQAFLDGREPEILGDLEKFITQETPSDRKDLLDSFSRYLSTYAKGFGAEVEIVQAEGSGDHVLCSWHPSGHADVSPVFLLGHYDTVWSSGTLEDMPFVVAGGRATGPGIFDMKCGLLQGFWAVRTLLELGLLNRPVTFLCNSDEEIGSPTSRELIEGIAKTSSHVLVFEPSLDGALKTARKGVGIFDIRVSGIPAHAGLDPDGGVSAVEELADLIRTMKSFADPDLGTTVNVGTINGGTRFNVIAAEATAGVDVRVSTQAEADRIEAAFSSLRPRNPRAEVVVEGGMMWPPMERTEKVTGMFDFARERALRLGFDLREGSAGGASDGCYCAAMGAAVIDGLGAVGGGAHARHEYVDVSAITQRVALAALIIHDLGEATEPLQA